LDPRLGGESNKKKGLEDLTWKSERQRANFVGEKRNFCRKERIRKRKRSGGSVALSTKKRENGGKKKVEKTEERETDINTFAGGTQKRQTLPKMGEISEKKDAKTQKEVSVGNETTGNAERSLGLWEAREWDSHTWGNSTCLTALSKRPGCNKTRIHRGKNPEVNKKAITSCRGTADGIDGIEGELQRGGDEKGEDTGGQVETNCRQLAGENARKRKGFSKKD